jgi:LmbE family N-acetylglucosaminyl deacetylase
LSRSNATPEGPARTYTLLRRLVAAPRPALRVTVVSAHPDDETLGAGALLSRLADPWVVCLTDGAPRDPRFVPAGAPRQPTAYARLRRGELRDAMALAGVGADRVLQLAAADQGASDDLPGMVNRLTLLLRGLRPQLVITHAYEGGHPDHDGAAFAMRAVVERLGREEGWSPGLAEMLSYHREEDEVSAARFLPASTDRWAVTLRLSPRERRLRERMLACFSSRAEALLVLGERGYERFRPAPRYDFTLAPHAGELHYESLGFAISGEQWRQLAADARRALAA